MLHRNKTKSHLIEQATSQDKRKQTNQTKVRTPTAQLFGLIVVTATDAKTHPRPYEFEPCTRRIIHVHIPLKGCYV